MSEQAQKVYQQLCKAVETDQIKLPTLPDVALKIRQAVEQDNQSAESIATLISQDAALAARLLQLANSPLYRARNEIDSLQLAITRLGIRIVKDLVVMLAIKQAFSASNSAIEKQFRKVWHTSIDVAAVCRVLAKTQSGLNSEQAVLAGLIHNIGMLPIIELAEREPALFAEPHSLFDISNEIQGNLGEKILSFWNFPQYMIEVVSQWKNFNRQHEDHADYVDIVQAAILHSKHKPSGTPDDWSTVPAIEKLGLDPSIREFDESLQSQLEETRSSLMSI